jgi:Ca2+-binding RTX toxin-like protein
LKRTRIAVVNRRRVSIALIHNQTKEVAMTRLSIFGRLFGLGLADQLGRDDKARSRRLEAMVEGLEGRQLLTGGSVVQSGALVTITPASVGPNVAIVSYQSHNGGTMLDVNLNGTDNFFSLSQISFVYYEGSGISGAQTFKDSTSLHSVAWGGSGNNLFQGGSGQDDFFGGSGSNTLVAGSGYDLLIGGNGVNVFNENATGLGEILNVPPGAAGQYTVV